MARCQYTSLTYIWNVIQTQNRSAIILASKQTLEMTMDKIVAFSIVAVLLAIGFVRLLREVLRIEEKIRNTNDFLSYFEKYVHSHGDDYDVYSWLIQKSHKIQTLMGKYGIFSFFHDPNSNYDHSNYPVILNLIPEIRKKIEDASTLRKARILNDYIALVKESLLRFMGVLNDELEPKKKKLKNPVIWFSEGVSWALLLPFLLVHWAGLFSERLVNGIADNALFKIFAGIVSLLGVISTVMTIIIGWGAFLSALRNLLTP